MAGAKIVKPQSGYQELALSSSADIVIGGGAAGSGKTFSLLLDPIRYLHIKKFGAVIFRRLTTQIKAPGGLWDESSDIYKSFGGTPNQTDLKWSFPEGSSIKFSHLEHEHNVTNWQGSQIPYIGFDELTHFSKHSFFYLLSRNRSNCGVKPCVRATCNPDPDSWVFELIRWWIGNDGYPIPERRGVVRYFVKDGNGMIWGDSVEEVVDKASYFLEPLVEASGIEPEHFVKSITFIGGTLYENKKLLEVNPEYLANLAAQDEESRNQLLGGNWLVAQNPADVYQYEAFKDIFTNDHVGGGGKYITVDVALGGQDKLIAFTWDGYTIIDCTISKKSTGKDVLEVITRQQKKHSVPNRNVTYDADGVGGFIGGAGNSFLPHSKAFHNGAKQASTKDGRKFKNLKTQCYILNGERVERNEIYLIPEVANMMYDSKNTIRQRLIKERKAIKIKAQRDEEPMALIPKAEMKQKYLNGDSPDLLDAMMMREFFDVGVAAAPQSSTGPRARHNIRRL